MRSVVMGGDDRAHLDRRRVHLALDDLALLVTARVPDLHHQHEPINLRLRQLVGPLLVDRVLGRHHDERLLERVRRVADRDLALLHRLEQRALHLRRGAVDLVRQDDVGEDRPLLGRELAALRVVDERADEIRRQQVRRELDALEVRLQRGREGIDRQRLRESGHTLEQHVAAGQETEHHPLHHVALADDDLVHLRGDVVDERALLAHQVVDDRDVVLHRR
jgi:hypothetical protein